MSSTNQLITLLGFSLLIVGLVGVFFAIIIGRIVATSGLRPVRRLHMAVNRVRKTDELTPIEVVGNDELAMLTHSFNDMLHALEQSRRRQAELVANAGHELKTPLTSMRTNIELLMMMQRSGSAQHMSAEDRAAIEHDVMAQMEELSTLIGDLVDLARDDAPPTVLEEVEMSRVIDRALDRVRRRRPDIEFTVNTIKWYLDGDSHGLERAILNLMDNAAKWSPQDGCVRIAMTPVSAHSVEITVSDSGPGIPVEDREKVFERFFRSVQARSTPGSGLGLAIVKQAILRHGGTISAMESEDGGTKMSVILPGAQTAAQLEKISQAKR
nr:HAMP domain-containing sensor histidine kinase [Corynebacterium sp. sy017]